MQARAGEASGWKLLAPAGCAARPLEQRTMCGIEGNLRRLLRTLLTISAEVGMIMPIANYPAHHLSDPGQLEIAILDEFWTT